MSSSREPPLGRRTHEMQACAERDGCWISVIAASVASLDGRPVSFSSFHMSLLLLLNSHTSDRGGSRPASVKSAAMQVVRAAGGCDEGRLRLGLLCWMLPMPLPRADRMPLRMLRARPLVSSLLPSLPPLPLRCPPHLSSPPFLVHLHCSRTTSPQRRRPPARAATRAMC